MASSARTLGARITTRGHALAADRVAMIGRIHRHLHSNDGVENVAFKRFLEELGRDVTAMMSAAVCAERPIAVEGVELDLPTIIGIPLGFVASELITNALKYGVGPVMVRLERESLPVGSRFRSKMPALRCRRGFDPAASKGFGMRIIRSFVAKIGGELRIVRGANNQGACFRSILHDEGSRQGYRSWLVDGLWLREAIARTCESLFGSRRGHSCEALPAAFR